MGFCAELDRDLNVFTFIRQFLMSRYVSIPQEVHLLIVFLDSS